MTGIDPAEVLTPIWETWDANPGSHTAAVAKENALALFGIDSIRAHQLIADHRRRAVAGQPGGLSIPDAVQSALNELLPAPNTKEAS